MRTYTAYSRNGKASKVAEPQLEQMRRFYVRPGYLKRVSELFLADLCVLDAEHGINPREVLCEIDYLETDPYL